MDVFAELLNYSQTTLDVPAGDHEVGQTVELVNDVTEARINYTITALEAVGTDTRLLLDVIV